MFLLAGGDGGGCRWGGVRGGRSRRSDLGFYSVFRCGRREGGAVDGWAVLVRLGNLQLALHEALDLVRLMDLLVDLALHRIDRAPYRARPFAHLAHQRGELLGPHHQQRHDGDQYDFGEADVEHEPTSDLVFALFLDGRRRINGVACGLVLDTFLGGRSLGVFLPSPMESRNPFTAPPRSAPMERSFFAPNRSSTINNTISKWPILLPISQLSVHDRRGGMAPILRHHAEFYTFPARGTAGITPTFLGLIRRAPRLFSHARQTNTTLQFRQHIVRVQTLLRQQDQRVKPQVRGFTDDLVRRTVLRRHHGLGGLLADLFQDRIEALRIKPSHIGALRIRTLAGLEHFGKPRQDLTHEARRPCKSRPPLSRPGPPSATGRLHSGEKNNCGVPCDKRSRLSVPP